jgi:RNA-directed DNA polymerase
MISLCSRFDSVLFTPKVSAIASYGNFRGPLKSYHSFRLLWLAPSGATSKQFPSNRGVRGAVDAVKEVLRLICRGYTDVVDADLSRYFDTIPHDELMKSVARRIADRHVLRLIKLWLKAPIEERDDDDRARRIGGGKSNMCGTPQGGVVSPLLANIYMNRFLKYWRLTGRGEAFRAHVIAYAVDFVILSRGCAAEAMAWMKVVMTRLGLTLNEAKTSLKNARQERFDFLG